MSKQRLICVVGPTASGKTELGVDLAVKLNGEIISADSMQVYKGMPIASAVPDFEEKKGINHRLMEFMSIDNQLTVADYVSLAKREIGDVIKSGKMPILVGGTGLYIDSLVNNIEFFLENFNDETRKRIETEYDENGGEEMLKRLSYFDAVTAERLEANDKKRIVRAFEIYENTGITMSRQYELSRQNPSPYDAVIIGLTYRDRQKLYDRINLRVEKMTENGILDEARKSFEYFDKSGGGFAAIGHKEFFPYFEGKITLSEAVENLKQQTRRYAKRQLTWFRKNENIHWIYKDETPDVLSEALKIIKGCEA